MDTADSSTPVGYFEDIYRADPDPWAYGWRRTLRTLVAGRLYQQRKYWETLRIIPRQRYANALEIGCSIGVFTRSLSRRCERLLAIDYSPTALALASQRCAKLHHVQLRQARVPEQFPEGSFDLIVLSEVAYYLSPEDFVATAGKILSALAPAGFLVLVHYRHHRDLPTGGDEAHDWFIREAKPRLLHLKDRRRAAHRLDLFQKAPAG